MTLAKVDIADNLHRVLGINKRDAKELVDLFFEELSLALESGHNIKLSGFGNFILRDKKQRPGRNPKTGKAAAISARRVVTFKAGQKLKNRVDISNRKHSTNESMQAAALTDAY